MPTTSGMPPGRTLRSVRRAVTSHVPDWVWPREVTIDGAVIALRDAPYVFGIKRLLRSGAYEAEERALVNSLLVPGMQVVELGGSIGILAAIASKAVGPSGRVVTVEASPDLSAYSRSWLERPGGNVTVVTGAAVPMWHAPADLRVRGFAADSNSLLGQVDFATVESGDRLWDVERLCREFNLEPEVLIVDIEGSEQVVVDAPLQLPPSVCHLVIELHPHLYSGGSDDERRIRERIAADGFVVANVRGNTVHFERHAVATVV